MKIDTDTFHLPSNTIYLTKPFKLFLLLTNYLSVTAGVQMLYDFFLLHSASDAELILN